MISIIKYLDEEFKFKYTFKVWLFLIGLIIIVNSLDFSQYFYRGYLGFFTTYTIIIFSISVLFKLLVENNEFLFNFFIKKIDKHFFTKKNKLKLLIFLKQCMAILVIFISFSISYLFIVILIALMSAISFVNLDYNKVILNNLFVILLFIVMISYVKKIYYNKVIDNKIIKYIKDNS